MRKITFIGAGSTIFAKNVLGDCFFFEALQDIEIALYDIDAQRLEESHRLISTMHRNMCGGSTHIQSYCGIEQRKNALDHADVVINAIQVGGYKPSTVIDFEIPKKYGLRQTIADTLGIGGIFRALRTIPIMRDIARDMETMCPSAWFINYTNPMAMLTGAMLRGTDIKTVGLCHSVQTCVPELLQKMGITDIKAEDVQHRIAGINHMAWLLDATHNGEDLYPRFMQRAKEMNDAAFTDMSKRHDDMVRFELMQALGYYVTESSEHNAEYSSLWIKRAYPELIEKYNIPLDEYITRCEDQIVDWAKKQKDLLCSLNIEHKKSGEYCASIINAIATNTPYAFHGNVLNTGLITNLPHTACVEVPCLVDANGVQACYVGALPPQCAAFNQTNINVQELTIQAALTLKRDHIYHAALLDPHTSAELTIDGIRNLCDDLIDAHGDFLTQCT